MNRQFPPEIVQLIVKASLDPYDLFTASTHGSPIHYDILGSYCLLNSTWYGASQPELLRSVELRTNESGEEFLEMAERRGGTVEGVRDLYVSANYDGDSSTLPKLLKSTPHLLNLYCNDVAMELGDLAPLQKLCRLQLVTVDVAGSHSSSRLCLPHLRRLAMIDLRLQEPAPHFLTPACLRRLRRLETDDFDFTDPLIPQLEIINPYSEAVDYPLLSHAKSLLLLPLSQYFDERLDMLFNLPSLPPFLHIDYASVMDFDDVDYEVALALEELLGAKKPGLRIILLNDHGIEDSVKSLIQRLQERGIRVQLVDKELDFDGAIEEMYRIRAEEKRASEAAL